MRLLIRLTLLACLLAGALYVLGRASGPGHELYAQIGHMVDQARTVIDNALSGGSK